MVHFTMNNCMRLSIFGYIYSLFSHHNINFLFYNNFDFSYNNNSNNNHSNNNNSSSNFIFVHYVNNKIDYS